MRSSLRRAARAAVYGVLVASCDPFAADAPSRADLTIPTGITDLGTATSGSDAFYTRLAEDAPAGATRVRLVDVNVHGVFHCNRAVVPYMLREQYGRIVNVASVAGKEGNPNASAYSASKAAVIGLTKSLGKELAKTPITVNCITPAAVRTAIFDQMTPAHIDFMLSKIPRNRFVTVDEVAALIAFAASEDCSFTTGSVLDISGGRATY